MYRHIDKKIEGKTIRNCFLSGAEVIMQFTDGSLFHYEASDGNMSLWEYYSKEDVPKYLRFEYEDNEIEKG